MILYNVTIKVNLSIADAWLKWINEEHIPEVINTGCFTKATLLRLLEVDNSEGLTYAVQYVANDIENYRHYINDHADIMRKKSIDKWGSGFIAFRSVMEFVN